MKIAMDDFFSRQINVLEKLIDEYRRGAFSLNSLIQRIEGINELLGMAEWKNAVYPIVLSMEQINAFALDANKGLTEADKISVNNSLSELEALINCFKHGSSCRIPDDSILADEGRVVGEKHTTCSWRP
jgi:hypothetical protein